MAALRKQVTPAGSCPGGFVAILPFLSASSHFFTLRSSSSPGGQPIDMQTHLPAMTAQTLQHCVKQGIVIESGNPSYDALSLPCLVRCRGFPRGFVRVWRLINEHSGARTDAHSGANCCQVSQLPFVRPKRVSVPERAAWQVLPHVAAVKEVVLSNTSACIPASPFVTSFGSS